MMLYIDSISKGIVIDHIRPGNGFKIFKYLGLNKADFRVALIINAQSKKYGKKDLIKLENVMDLDLTMLGFIDPNITINIIQDEKVVKKIKLSLPEEVEGIIKCKNPRCICSEERQIVHRFVLIDDKKGIYKCDYCEQIYSWEG